MNSKDLFRHHEPLLPPDPVKPILPRQPRRWLLIAAGYVFTLSCGVYAGTKLMAPTVEKSIASVNKSAIDLRSVQGRVEAANIVASIATRELQSCVGNLVQLSANQE